LEELVKVSKALSDENRLKVLALILQNEDVCVCEVSATLGFSQPLASKYLKQLKEAGLVQSKKVGRWSIFFAVEHPLAHPFYERLKKMELPKVVRCSRC
jgi:ArsR family transcriptional regulator